MEWKLELVVVPVADVDRAKRFYSEQCGFVVDHDTRISDQFRVVQLTPPGSACSITIGTGLVDSAPGSLQGLQLVVPDIAAARAGPRAREQDRRSASRTHVLGCERGQVAPRRLVIKTEDGGGAAGTIGYAGPEFGLPTAP